MVGGIFSGAKTKIKENRRGERSSVCRAKLRRYLKQKRKCKAELATLSVAERGEKKEKRAHFKGSLFGYGFFEFAIDILCSLCYYNYRKGTPMTVAPLAIGQR